MYFLFWFDNCFLICLMLINILVLWLFFPSPLPLPPHLSDFLTFSSPPPHLSLSISQRSISLSGLCLSLTLGGHSIWGWWLRLSLRCTASCPGWSRDSISLRETYGWLTKRWRAWRPRLLRLVGPLSLARCLWSAEWASRPPHPNLTEGRVVVWVVVWATPAHMWMSPRVHQYSR